MTESADLVIIGSGPAGLSAAARAAARGLSHLLLEKTDHLSDTIFRYQRGKHVMATPAQLTLRSDLSFDAGRREHVLGVWDNEAARARVKVRYNAEVTAISGQRGAFVLSLRAGGEVRAKVVVLAVGTSGNPNQLKIPGADHPLVQYQLDDPRDHFDQDIVVVGGGDAGIENALGLAEPDLANRVTLLHRGADFSRAKAANVALLEEARDEGRIVVLTEAAPRSLEAGMLLVDTREGEARLRVDRVIARMGATPPRAFLEACGVAFTGPDREAFPVLTPSFETTVSGLYVIGALAGYPLIKHCLNQGYDVIERIAGVTDLKPADEPLLAAKTDPLPIKRDLEDWLEAFRSGVEVLQDLSPLQMREFLLDSEVHAFAPGEAIITRNELGSSLFAIVEGAVAVEVDPTNPAITVPIGKGQIFGEVGLISGRRRGATVRAAQDPTIVIEAPRTAALKLMATVPGVKRRIDRLVSERMLKQVFGQDLDKSLFDEALDGAALKTFRAGEALIREDEIGYDIFLIRSGSAVVEKTLGAKQVFLSYVPAGAYVGEMSLFDEGKRNASVKAAVKTEALVLPGEAFQRILAKEPALARRVEQQVASRRQVNQFIEGQKAGFGSVVDMYSSVASFLIQEGLGDATDALLIDETLCIGCDNCETACAETHQGISRLDREAGRTFAHLHVPTSCRHCEHPHCMSDCPPNAIHRAPDGEVFITDACIGCGACQRNCPYGVIQMERTPPQKPGLLQWLLLGLGPGPGQPDPDWVETRLGKAKAQSPKVAVKCDMCKGVDGGPACVRACPTGAAIRVSPETYLEAARLAQADPL